jgi:DNA helicase-2/ATP-dependent DNA helicase PcrA
VLQITPELANIIKAGASKDDLLIEALAGTGKTTALLELLKTLPQKSVLVCAFNKAIQTELDGKIRALAKPKGMVVHVKTMHSIGLSIVKQHYPSLDVDGDSTELLVIKAEARHGKGSARTRYAAVRLVRTIKDTRIEITPSGKPWSIDAEDAWDVANEFDIFQRLNESEMERAVQLALTAYDLSLDVSQRDSIDFCDMVWMPVALGLSSQSRYHAVIVDEWQDLSAPQFELMKRMIAPGGRLIMAGDIKQAIYGWRGATGEMIRTELLTGTRAPLASVGPGVKGAPIRPAKALPLTVTWRCSKAVTVEAQKLVPAIQHAPDAEVGTVSTIALADLPLRLGQGRSEKIHTFVLSRNNADLLDAEFRLWREKMRFQLNAGQDMLEPLFHLLDYTLNLSTSEAFTASLADWRDKQHAKAAKTNAPCTAWLARVDEQHGMLTRALHYAVRPTGIKQLLRDLLQPGTTGVMLSSVHKVKGLEAERVFLLKQTFQRHRPPPWVTCRSCGGSGDGEVRGRDCSNCNGEGMFVYRDTYGLDQEELNVEYVAITRAKTHLVWVCNEKQSVIPADPLKVSLTGLKRDALEALLDDVEREAVHLEDGERADQLSALAVRIKTALLRAQ